MLRAREGLESLLVSSAKATLEESLGRRHSEFPRCGCRSESLHMAPLENLWVVFRLSESGQLRMKGMCQTY